MVTLVNDQMPPIRRPGAISDRRRLVEAALADGRKRTGEADSGRAARDEVKRLRWHAGQVGAKLTARYEELSKTGLTRWHVVISPKGSKA